MSTILKALRRVEKDRVHTQDIPLREAVVAATVGRPLRQRHWWRKALAFGLSAGVLIAFFVLGWLRGEDAPVPELPRDWASRPSEVDPVPVAEQHPVEPTLALAAPEVSASPPELAAPLAEPAQPVAMEVAMEAIAAPTADPVVATGTAEIVVAPTAPPLNAAPPTAPQATPPPTTEPNPGAEAPAASAPQQTAAEPAIAEAAATPTPIVEKREVPTPSSAQEQATSPAAAPVPPATATSTAAKQVAAAPAAEKPKSTAPTAKPAPSKSSTLPAVAAAAGPNLLVERTIWHPLPEKRTAFLALEGGSTIRVVEGEELGDYTVDKIGPSTVTFLRDGQSYIRRIGVR